MIDVLKDRRGVQFESPLIGLYIEVRFQLPLFCPMERVVDALTRWGRTCSSTAISIERASALCDIQVLDRAANRTMIHSLHRRLSLFLSLLLSLPVLCQGWETGSEYLYDYSGLLVTGIQDADHQSAAVQIIAKLTVQCVDDETLMLKMSEIRVTRDGNYSSNGRLSDPILLPVGLADGEKEAIGDSLHLLSTFAVIHNKGSITNLVVESEEPTWSVNIKKAVASNLQLDVFGVRSGLDGGVFGERNAPALSSLEDGVTGDCFTTLRITRLPFYQVIQNHDLEAHKIIGEICRANKVFEIMKTKDFDQCRKDPLKISSNPLSSTASSFSSRNKDMLQRFASYKYLACGESSEKNTVVRMEGVGKLVFSGPIKLKTQHVVRLVILSRGQIRNLLPSLSQPQVIEDLTFSFEEDSTVASAKEVQAVFEVLQEVGQTLKESTLSEDDISKKLRIISQIIFRLDESQLREIWRKTFQPGNATVRDLFVDCIAASGSHTSVVFLVDLIERRELEGLQAIWTLMSSGHSMQQPKIPTLRRFLGIIRSEAARDSKLLRHTALMASADLLYTSCVLSTVNCNADAQIITEEFLPLLVHELETAQTAIDRLAAILSLGALGVDDVLLLLVPYIRGEDVAVRIAAIMSLKRLMDFSPDKVIPLLASLADNVAEHPEIRMAAISMLLFHKKTPMNIWKKIASRTWFDPSHQVAVFTCDIIQSVSEETHSSGDESTSIKARSVIGLLRPCSGRSEFEHYASVKDNTAGLSSLLLAFWKLKDSSMPVYLQHQLFRQLGSFRLDLAKVSIWNFNMDSVWSQLLKHDDDILQSSESKSNVFWDQLSLNFRTNDQPTVGLFHARLFGSTMQTLFNLEDIDREYMIRVFFTRHINIRFVKFQQLIDIRTHVPTELGLPARFTFSLTALASALGHIHQPEINMTASLSLKWETESRIQCPFSGHHVAAGVENTAEIRFPIFLISNGSMVWIPPDRIYDLAYYNIKPYTFTSQTKDHSSETWELAKANHISTKPPFVSVAQLSLNLRLETTSELPQEDPASAWLNSLMKEYSCDSGHFRLDDFQQRVYRLRYLPKEGPLSSVSLSASFNTETIQENADVQYILGVNGSMEWDEDGANDTTSLFRMKDDSIHVYKGGITVHYGNGSMLNWASIEIAAQSLSEENEWNITASGSTIGSVRNWLNSKNIKYLQDLQDERSTTSRERYNNASEPYFQRIHFKIRESEVPLLRYASVTSLFPAKSSLHNVNREKTTKKRCVIHSDHVVTYDGVEYNYTINECHHLLTADCVQKRAKYAIMGTNESHGMVVRITLEKDIIDVSSAGNISINGIEANFTARRMRIHMGEKVIATATLNKENVIHLRLSDEDLDVFVQKSTITLSVGEKLLGHACGMCGDGDSEMTGEFKTSNRCALSSGTLMAASFQINVGPENCPSMSDEILQALLMESYPCYSVDEQVASILPLPLEF